MRHNSVIADPTFGLNSQALAILALLAQTAPTDVAYDKKTKLFAVFIQTFPFYNGRERGVCLAVQRGAGGGGETMLLAFAEHRNTDGIILQKQMIAHSVMNMPTIDDFSEDSYRARESFDWGACGRVVNVILGHIAEFCGEKSK